MSEVIGEFHIKRYDDDTIELSAGSYPDIGQLTFDIGKMVNGNLTGEKVTYIQRRSLTHYVSRAFVEGLQADPAAITWRDPQDKAYLPKRSRDRVLFATKDFDRFLDSKVFVRLGYYAPDTEEFIEDPCDHNENKAAFEIEEVACWMPVPYPISFEEEEDV